MSAIFGMVHFDGRPVEQPDLARMAVALAHHGADGGGLWLGGAVGLGQRLRRFTPPDALERQPLVSADRAIVLVADARLDNRADLLGDRGLGVRDLGYGPPQSPIPSPQLSDSELILAAYHTWGPACVSRLTGVFAFAIWDTRRQALFAARSPIEAPSLVYAARAATFAFATMPSGLHALPFIQRSLDEESVARLLTRIGSRPDDTLYRGILRLPTGHWLLADRDGVRTECYWRPDLAPEIRYGRDEEYLEAFNDLFARVVGDHLSSVTPVAVQMSGGLDSSAVAAVAARTLAARGERLAAFTEVPRAGFDDRSSPRSYADETPFVQAIAALHPNLDLNLMRTDGQFFLNDLDALFAHLEAPFQNTSNRVWIEAILAESSRRGLRVLLDGMQGNLTLSWNGSGWLSGPLHARQWGTAMRQTQAFAQVRGWPSALRAVLGQGLLPLLPDPAWLAVNKLRHPLGGATQPWRLSPIHPDFAAAHGVTEAALDRRLTLNARPKVDTRQIRYEALANQDGGAYLSAYRAMYGVDMRSPTADVRLTEFCLALPEDQYMRNGQPRSLIRRAMVGQLPPLVLENRRRGLQAADWFERLLGARAQVGAELARMERSELARRVLDLDRLRQLHERLPTNAGEAPSADRTYQWTLQGGLMVGAFLCWFEAGA